MTPERVLEVGRPACCRVCRRPVLGVNRLGASSYAPLGYAPNGKRHAHPRETGCARCGIPTFLAPWEPGGRPLPTEIATGMRHDHARCRAARMPHKAQKRPRTGVLYQTGVRAHDDA